MARGQANCITNKSRRQAQGKRPRGIKKLSQRPVRKSARLEKIQKQIEIEEKTTGLKPALPSPSTSNTPNKEVLQSSSVLSKAFTPLKWTRKSCPNLNLEEVEQPRSQNGCESIDKLDRKRKRSPEAENLTLQVQGEPIEKRARISLPDKATGSKEGASDIKIENTSPIEYWRKTGNWPKKFFEPDPNMSQQLTKKRSSSAMSYSQGVRVGEYPPAHTPAYEKQVLEPAGIIMDQQLGEATISNGCKQLCTILVDATYKPPQNSLFEGDFFWKVLNGVRSRNEPRVVRDISPWLIPSVELLFMRGFSNLKNLTEEIQTDWTKCVPLAGPLPRPDFTVGFQSSAFTNDEIEKLKYHSVPEKPTLFTGDLYFPFLICEVKCGENGLNIADRQNARSASTAVNAILRLYPTVSRSKQLHRKVLVFSVSHDHDMVKIYGHYALIGKDKSTFHRHLVHSFDITAYDGKNRWTAYNFVRKLYDHFAPIHLKRIRDAVALLGPASESFMSHTCGENDSELPDSQETASAPASQDNEAFKKPSKKKRWNKGTEIALLQQELERQRHESERQRYELERQREEANQLREESKLQLAREKEESKQRHAELMEQNKKLIDMLSKI